MTTVRCVAGLIGTAFFISGLSTCSKTGTPSADPRVVGCNQIELGGETFQVACPAGATSFDHRDGSLAVRVFCASGCIVGIESIAARPAGIGTGGATASSPPEMTGVGGVGGVGGASGPPREPDAAVIQPETDPEIAALSPAAPQFLRCVWSTEPTTVVAKLSANSAAELQGPKVRPVQPSPTIKRDVPFKFLLPPASEFEFGPATLVRRESSDRAELWLPVRNQGQRYLCFLRAEKVRWLTATGLEVVMEPSREGDAYVLGGQGTPPIAPPPGAPPFPPFCLGPGENGYVLDSRSLGTTPFESIERVESLSFEGRPGAPTMATLLPQAYNVGLCMNRLALRVLVRNVGTVAAQLIGRMAGRLVFLDDGGRPSALISLHSAPGVGVVAPGQLVAFYGDPGSFFEPSERMRIFLEGFAP